ncbi:hypothetical protein V8C86DRAFT_2433645 [Haematococcus lacustris]
MKPKEHAAPGFSRGQVQFWQTLVDQAYAGEGDLHDYDAAPRSVYKSKTDCSAAVKPVALVTTSPAPCSNLTELPDDVLVLVVSQLVGPPDRGRYTVLRPASSQKLQHRPSNVTGVQPASSGAAGPIHYAQQAGPVARAHSSSMVPRTVTSMGIATDPGLADVARLSMTCSCCVPASLQARPSTVCTLLCLEKHRVFTLTHVLIHTALLAAAYRTAARVGARRALLLGLAAILLYYCVVVWAVQRLSGITQPKSAVSAGVHSAGQLGGAAVAVPAHVSLPYYPLAVLIWPFFGVGLRWRLIHVLSNSFAWAYGVWEFRASYRYVKLRNGLWLNSPSRRLDK